eukprot:272956-Chlamydomonas_euryale.AAC.1
MRGSCRAPARHRASAPYKGDALSVDALGGWEWVWTAGVSGNEGGKMEGRVRMREATRQAGGQKRRGGAGEHLYGVEGRGFVGSKWWSALCGTEERRTIKCLGEKEEKHKDVWGSELARLTGEGPRYAYGGMRPNDGEGA